MTKHTPTKVIQGVAAQSVKLGAIIVAYGYPWRVKAVSQDSEFPEIVYVDVEYAERKGFTAPPRQHRKTTLDFKIGKTLITI